MQHRLLIVDDEAQIGKALTRVLRRKEYDIAYAASPAEGYRVLAESPIDVVISDYQMPGENGIDFLANVRDRHPDTVRLMLSGQADMEAVIAALNSGAIFKFLIKPWQNEAIREVVSDAFALADSQRGPRDSETGWLSRAGMLLASKRQFQDQLRAVVVGEWMDAARLLNSVQEDARAGVFTLLAERIQSVSPLPIEVALVERATFAFVIPVADIDVDDTLEALSTALGQPLNLGSDSRRGTFRLAAADFDVDGCVEAALRNALSALDVADSGGWLQFTDDLGVKLHKRRTLERDLHYALEREELFLALQPQYCLAAGEIRSAEALLRWRHPRLGAISPLLVVDMAERNGLINDIGEWIATRGAEQLQQWRSIGRDDLRLSINVSPRQFINGDIVGRLTALLQEFGLKPECLEVEITESCVMADPKDAARRLSSLRDAGVRVALDDFGTGYSSLAQINQLPLDVLKIDRSFIRDVAEPESDAYRLLGQVITMANNLGLETVAEGVETQEQLDACAAFGCSMIQGFLISKPIPPSDFLKLVTNGERQ